MYLQPCLFSLRKNVKGFPLYSVSNYGEVRNLETNRTLSFSIAKFGYHSVRCCAKKVHKRFLLHRLVLQSFCGIKEGCAIAGHKDDNPRNNDLTNLYWTTQSENVQKAYDAGRAKSPKVMTGKSGKLHHNSKEIVGYNESGNEVIRFESISIARINGYHMAYTRKGLRAKGLTFKYNQ